MSCTQCGLHSAERIEVSNPCPHDWQIIGSTESGRQETDNITLNFLSMLLLVQYLDVTHGYHELI